MLQIFGARNFEVHEVAGYVDYGDDEVAGGEEYDWSLGIAEAVPVDQVGTNGE